MRQSQILQLVLQSGSIDDLIKEVEDEKTHKA